jgi:hypothetical protein
MLNYHEANCDAPSLRQDQRGALVAVVLYLEATDRDGEENEGLMEMGGHQRLMIVSTC